MDSATNKIMATLSFAASFCLLAFGIYTMVAYGDGSTYSPGGQVGHIVGGDAYNFIIIAARGAGYIAGGVIFAVCGAAASITGAIKEHASTVTNQVWTVAEQVSKQAQEAAVAENNR